MAARVTALLALAAALCVVPLAQADPPTREPLPAADATGRFCTGFDVRIHIVENREIFTAFADGRGLITGALKNEVTNLSTMKTVAVNASGPVSISDEGAHLVFRGRTLLFGEAGFFGAGAPPTLKLVSGVVEFMLPDLEIRSVEGSVTDLCAVLADP
jgi:hypothetical protein